MQSGIKLPEQENLPARIENVVFISDKDGLATIRQLEYSKEADRFSGRNNKPSDKQ